MHGQRSGHGFLRGLQKDCTVACQDRLATSAGQSPGNKQCEKFGTLENIVAPIRAGHKFRAIAKSGFDIIAKRTKPSSIGRICWHHATTAEK